MSKKTSGLTFYSVDDFIQGSSSTPNIHYHPVQEWNILNDCVSTTNYMITLPNEPQATAQQNFESALCDDHANIGFSG